MHVMGKESPELKWRIIDMIYKDVTINYKKARAMADIVATDNIITRGKAWRLGLNMVEKGVA